MLDLRSIGLHIAQRRRVLDLTQSALSQQAGISRATLDALENGRAREVGFGKLVKLLNVLGLELKLEAATSHRPTLEELLEEDRHAQDLDRRR